MVDLRAELRPFVEEPARDPLPIAEIEARAHRRRLRKRTAAAVGIAAGFVGSVGLIVALGAQDPTGRVTTADQPEAPATAPSTTAAPAPPAVDTPASTTPAEPDPGGLIAPAGIAATATTTSSWEDGSCVEVRLTNTTSDAVDWEVLVTPPGPITTVWNATTRETDGQIAFRGDEWNARLAPGLDTTFGYCIGT